MAASVSDDEMAVLRAFMGYGDKASHPPHVEVIAHRVDREADEVAGILTRLADRPFPLVVARGKEQPSYPFERYQLTSEGLKVVEGTP